MQSAADEAVEFKNDLRAQLAAAALVSFRRIRIAVAKDNLACRKRRRQNLGDNLGAVGKHQRHLCHGRQPLRARVQNQRANAVAGLRTARLARDERAAAALFQPCRKTVDLCGFTGTIQAFERNKQTTWHGLSLPPQ